ncbi:MAG: class F sortase [Tepidiformaceae bacterium]
MLRRLAVLMLALAGASGVVLATVSGSAAPGSIAGTRVVVPAIARSLQPTPVPRPYAGPVASLTLESAALTSASGVEVRDTEFVGGEETFQLPTHPSLIAWYEAFGRPGFGGANSIFAAHIDYVNYGLGPFAYLTSADIGDTLYVRMDNGIEYAYTVLSVETIRLEDINMHSVVFPGLPSDRERVTLVSCGGTFVPYPGGGGQYNSRVILVAERSIP